MDFIDQLDAFDEGQPIRPPKRVRDDEIDLTPMIDVTFLLLIFFIVASTPDKVTAVDLPAAQHGDGVEQLYSLVISIGEGGDNAAPVYLADGKDPTFACSDDLKERDRQIVEATRKAFEEGKSNVVLKADRFVKCRDIDRVMKSVSKVQGMQINLAVLETEQDD